MRWLKIAASIFSPLFIAVLSAVILIYYDYIGGNWFFLIVIIGLSLSILNGIILILKIS
jgi:hypothetical protein